jgi:hypothetical protein
MQPGQAPSFTTTAVIYVVAIALLVWRMARPQRMSVARLWIMPIFLVAITAFSIYAGMYASVLAGEMPAPGWEIAVVLLGGAVLGLPLGFLRGRHSEVKPTERRGVMYVHSSPVIVVVWLAAFAGRQALRAFLPHARGAASLASDGLLGFAVAALITSYYAIYQKYRAAVQQAAAS